MKMTRENYDKLKLWADTRPSKLMVHEVPFEDGTPSGKYWVGVTFGPFESGKIDAFSLGSIEITDAK